MHHHAEKRVLPHTAEQMFDMVVDVDEYPKFLPWCVGARIFKREENAIHADLLIGYKVIREKFTSKVTFSRPNTIEVTYLGGPLKHLHNHWSFSNNENGSCTVDFVVEFAFVSTMFERMLGGVFDEIVHRMVGAFVDRASAIYASEQQIHKL